MSAAWISTTGAAPIAPASTPAKAGPTTIPRLRLVASIALARSSSSGPATSARALTKLPVLNGRVIPYSTATVGTVQSGACPARARIASRAATLSTWSATISTRRRWATSSQAPSNGPLSAPGRVEAAAVSPASPALPVRPSTSSTPEVMNIAPVMRDSETVRTKLGYRGRRSSAAYSRRVSERTVGIRPIVAHRVLTLRFPVKRHADDRRAPRRRPRPLRESAPSTMTPITVASAGSSETISA